MSTLDRAIQIAVSAHQGQLDKAGRPYVLHPLRMLFQMRTERERITAVLHDVVEDSDRTLEQLRQEGFAEEILAALDCLTQRESEEYTDYIERVRANPLATAVKIADLHDNLDASRLSELQDRDVARLRKYLRTLALLETADHP